MVEYYSGQAKFLLAVDCVLFGYEDKELQLLLYPRGFEPVKGKWSLMGGFIQPTESCEEAACRVLQQTTGLTNIFLEQVETFSKPGRENSTRVISIVFYALIDKKKYSQSLSKATGAKWYAITCLPELIFDHREMINKSLNKLQQKAGYSLLGAELLPEAFTLLQLRKLYEAIYLREFDAGNFRKKILSLGVLEKMDIKDMSESRKGAFYYRIGNNGNGLSGDRIVKMENQYITD